ncbi:MAG: hypothetical protein JO072_02290 [Parafilimonas sp.]|nr:hypothetical protein [Parafilimonas sp.]
MKYILITVFAFCFLPTFSQQLKLTISAANNSLTVIPEENDDSVFIINAPALSSKSFLTIYINSDVIPKDWKRDISIYNSDDSFIKDFVLMKDETYCIKLSEIKTLLQPGREYLIYTIARPKDPKKAMTMKFARVLVCKIKTL